MSSMSVVFRALFVWILASRISCSIAEEQKPFLEVHTSPQRLISDETNSYIADLLARWKSPGLSVAVVRRDASEENGWKFDFGSYGKSRGDGTSVDPDTAFAIASNSKLFLSISVGLLISNETLAQQRGQKIGWSTKIQDLIPEFQLQDEEVGRKVTIQDMLSHRTGLPRHDMSEPREEGAGRESAISSLRHLRLSAELRETYQYNNLMYNTLAHLPQVLLNQSYESYVAENIFKPLGMASSTLRVAEAESRGQLADGFFPDMQDLARGINGTLRPIIPYIPRPGEEIILAGSGGVFSSARDLSVWVAMLLNGGRHPFTNVTVVPEEVVQHVATGMSIQTDQPDYPEKSPTVYGSAQTRYSYQGHDLIEHGGANAGFMTQIARLPNDNLGVISLSNDYNGHFLMEAAKFRLIDDILQLRRVDWNSRYEKVVAATHESAKNVTPRPNPPQPPPFPFSTLAARVFTNPAYGNFQPCLVEQTSQTDSEMVSTPEPSCVSLLDSYAAKRILSASDLTTPTYLMTWRRGASTHLRLSHFSGNLFNVSVITSNAEDREAEGYGPGGDVLFGLDENFEVEWVTGEEEGLAFRGGFWGKGKNANSPTGRGKESAEVWFAKV